jgi:hypothetical protein
MFWKAKIEQKSNLPRTLKSAIIKQDGTRIIVRMTLDDGEFFDIEGPMPRFELGEQIHLTLREKFMVPTTETESTINGR